MYFELEAYSPKSTCAKVPKRSEQAANGWHATDAANNSTRSASFQSCAYNIHRGLFRRDRDTPTSAAAAQTDIISKQTTMKEQHQLQAVRRNPPLPSCQENAEGVTITFCCEKNDSKQSTTIDGHRVPRNYYSFHSIHSDRDSGSAELENSPRCEKNTLIPNFMEGKNTMMTTWPCFDDNNLLLELSAAPTINPEPTLREVTSSTNTATTNSTGSISSSNQDDSSMLRSTTRVSQLHNKEDSTNLLSLQEGPSIQSRSRGSFDCGSRNRSHSNVDRNMERLSRGCKDRGLIDAYDNGLPSSSSVTGVFLRKDENKKDQNQDELRNMSSVMSCNNSRKRSLHGIVRKRSDYEQLGTVHQRRVPLTAEILQSYHNSLSSFHETSSLKSGSSLTFCGAKQDTPEVTECIKDGASSENCSDNGYSASASSNGAPGLEPVSCPSPSLSSSEDRSSRKFPFPSKGENRRDSSSDIADFSSTNSANASSSYTTEDDESLECDSNIQVLQDSGSLSFFSSRKVTEKDKKRIVELLRCGDKSQDVKTSKNNEKCLNTTVVGTNTCNPVNDLSSRSSSSIDDVKANIAIPISRRLRMIKNSVLSKNTRGHVLQNSTFATYDSECDAKPASTVSEPLNLSESLLYHVGTDVMAHITSFMDPLDCHSFLTMPISKTFRTIYTLPQDIWKILCISEPFGAKFHDKDGSGSGGEDSISSYPICSKLELRHSIGRYRLLFTSFVRCVRYLERIKDDAVNGRRPLGIHEEEKGALQHPFSDNVSLMDFFARARQFVSDQQSHPADVYSSSTKDTNDESDFGNSSLRMHSKTASDSSSSFIKISSGKKKRGKKSNVTYGHSKLTERLLGPVQTSGMAGPVELPWSCAIYSVVNWMVAFADVEGIQIMCLNVLPSILEDEQQRTTAQRAGLMDVVLRAMVRFPGSVKLHTASFHTLVLLARPLGGREGMLFHQAMLNTLGIFSDHGNCSKSGIAVMLDSMKRFSREEVLQAMACWSMVNIALIPTQKKVLVSLGGIAAAANAMMQHPYNPEVQFRALFALINLVIPSAVVPENTAGQSQSNSPRNSDQSERELLDESVAQIANLVVLAMRNFCSSEAILNRACLVLHNLSLNERYHQALLFTPHCYQMLEWCIANYRNDSVLQQSAGGTLQRLQMTLADDSFLRRQFVESLQTQDRLALENARREAVLLQQVEHQQNA